MWCDHLRSSEAVWIRWYCGIDGSVQTSRPPPSVCVWCVCGCVNPHTERLDPPVPPLTQTLPAGGEGYERKILHPCCPLSLSLCVICPRLGWVQVGPEEAGERQQGISFLLETSVHRLSHRCSFPVLGLIAGTRRTSRGCVRDARCLCVFFRGIELNTARTFFTSWKEMAQAASQLKKKADLELAAAQEEKDKKKKGRKRSREPKKKVPVGLEAGVLWSFRDGWAV